MSDSKLEAKPAAAARPGGAAALAKREGDGEDETKRGPLRWVLGWIVLPGAVIGAIIGGGALVGAHFHDSWFTGAIVWVVDLF
jgi:hypothetical protein